MAYQDEALLIFPVVALAVIVRELLLGTLKFVTEFGGRRSAGGVI